MEKQRACDLLNKASVRFYTKLVFLSSALFTKREQAINDLWPFLIRTLTHGGGGGLGAGEWGVSPGHLEVVLEESN